MFGGLMKKKRLEKKRKESYTFGGNSITCTKIHVESVQYLHGCLVKLLTTKINIKK